jgi:hypothetical protein
VLFLGAATIHVQHADGLEVHLSGWLEIVYYRYLKFRNMLPKEDVKSKSIVKESFERKKRGHKKSSL